jgi:hypothetical protein
MGKHRLDPGDDRMWGGPDLTKTGASPPNSLDGETTSPADPATLDDGDAPGR